MLKNCDRLLVEEPIAIFINIMMPDVTGFEVWEELKWDQATCQIPAIAMTSKHFRLHHSLAVRDASNAR
ncbi:MULTISPECIES: hypothetical protein [unclassified Microcoleus]|uniref:hypothetical protein n=1 Tax=unclassified Microcoleus TaxID=2642155 RepID=UPI002FCF5F63